MWVNGRKTADLSVGIGKEGLVLLTVCFPGEVNVSMSCAFIFSVVLLSGVFAGGLAVSGRQAEAPLGQLVVPAGFQVDVFAENVKNARSMALGPQGTVFVGSQRAGKVHAVVDRNGDHKADRVVVIASGLDSAQWRRDAQRRAVRGDDEQDSAVRRHRAAPRLAARRPSSSVTACRTRSRATRGSSSRSGRTTAVHVGRRSVQRLRCPRRWCRPSCG